MLAGPSCPGVEMMIPAAGLDSEPCPYHHTGEFVLPPAMEWYYKSYHPEYTVRPSGSGALMEFLYPEQGSVLTLPRQLDGSVPGAVFQVVHRDPSAILFWHMDQSYLGETRIIHQMRLAPEEGKHTVTVVDAQGNTVSVNFAVR